MSEITTKHKNFLFASLVALVLLSSSLLVPTLSAYADKGNDKPKNDPPKNNSSPVTPHDDHPKNTNQQHDDHHKKGKKDPDHDHDKDKKECKNGDTKKNGKYKHNCDSDHDFK